MVVLNNIDTKKGDDGNTELGNGERVKKFSKRVEAYGTVDELNSLIGIVTSLDIENDFKNSLLKS
jgi:cob(I)alamin adenosyltransferase